MSVPCHYTAHSKVLLLRAYLKVIYNETMAFSFILGSNKPNQMPWGIRKKFCTPGVHGGGGSIGCQIWGLRESKLQVTFRYPKMQCAVGFWCLILRKI